METTEKNELPNLWVHHQEHIGASLLCEAIPECYSLSVRSRGNHLYVPAERLGEICEALRSSGLSLQQRSIVEELEAMIEEGHGKE